MYISGDKFNFEGRLHQLPTGSADLDLFILEKDSYLSSTPTGVVIKWDREIEKKKIILNIAPYN